jgi:hypothetical protein
MTSKTILIGICISKTIINQNGKIEKKRGGDLPLRRKSSGVATSIQLGGKV